MQFRCDIKEEIIQAATEFERVAEERLRAGKRRWGEQCPVPYDIIDMKSDE